MAELTARIIGRRRRGRDLASDCCRGIDGRLRAGRPNHTPPGRN